MAYSMIIARKPEVQTELLKYVLQSIDKDPCILDRINGKESEVNIAFKNGEHRRERHISELIGISFKGTDKYARQFTDMSFSTVLSIFECNINF